MSLTEAETHEPETIAAEDEVEADVDRLVEDVVVDEVSIDGMCGVY